MVKKSNRVGLGALALCGLLGCGSGDAGSGQPDMSTDDATSGNAAPPPADSSREGQGEPDLEPGVHMEDGELVFRTEPFTVPAGEESYLCWPATLEQAAKVKALEYAGRPVVHHFLFSQATAPEPEGFSKCDVLFKNSWRPVFAAGAGDSQLSFPDGVAHDFEAGTQLVVQLHLLNTTEEDITDVAEVRMTTTDEQDTQPVLIGAVGTTNIALPAAEESTVTAECSFPQDARLIAVMPHMHYLGRSLTFELGNDGDAMEMVYQRDPYDFDQQTIDPFEMSLEAGQRARVRCSYDNTTSQTVTFGESSLEEMCFLVTFSVGASSSCITR